MPTLYVLVTSSTRYLHIIFSTWAAGMLNVSPHDLASFVGPTTDFLKNEIVRVGAPLAELKIAIAFVGRETFDQRAYEALTPRMRRLVDLVGVAGTKLAASICETAEFGSMKPAA